MLDKDKQVQTVKRSHVLEIKAHAARTFETLLARRLFTHDKVLSHFKTLAAAVFQLIEDHEDELIAQLRSQRSDWPGGPKNHVGNAVKKELFGADRHGRLDLIAGDNLDALSEHAVLEQMKAVLQPEDGAAFDLNQACNVIAVFQQKLYNELGLKADELAKIKQQLWGDSKNLLRQPHREKRAHVIQPSKMNRGIHPDNVPTPVLNREQYKRANLGENRSINSLAVLLSKSGFIQNLHVKGVPTVAGPSGHTASLLMAAKLVADMSDSQLPWISLGAYAHLADGGNHSLAEVSVVLRDVLAMAQGSESADSAPWLLPDDVELKDLIDALNEVSPARHIDIEWLSTQHEELKPCRF